MKFLKGFLTGYILVGCLELLLPYLTGTDKAFEIVLFIAEPVFYIGNRWLNL